MNTYFDFVEAPFNTEDGTRYGRAWYAGLEFSNGRRFESYKRECTASVDQSGWFDSGSDDQSMAALEHYLQGLDLSIRGLKDTLLEHFREVSPVYGSAAYQDEEAAGLYAETAEKARQDDAMIHGYE
jgi:hypothetical protein